MAKLLLNNGSGQSQEIFLRSGLSRVGRNAANEIQIEHPSVSSFHCEITSAGDSLIIKDLGSTNGTFLDGKPVEEVCAFNGQRLQLGSVEVIVDAPETMVASPELEAVGAAPPPVPAISRPRLSVRLDNPPASATATPEPAPVMAPPGHHGRPAANKSPMEMDPAKVEAEARSKMMWGDAFEEVVKFLRMQGLGIPEASAMANALLQERVRALRGIGVQKILTGIGLMCVPVVAFFYFLHLGIFPIKLFAMTVAVGLYGAWRFLKGMFMVLAPKSEAGDVADK
jgi:pSer/pThr/pTyr-binding forkhead associated (FHA) protein